MSKQVIDSIYRSMRSVSAHIGKGNYQKALDILEKAEKQLESEDAPQLSHICLLLKGKVCEETGRLNEALDIYEGAFELSSELFFKDSAKYHLHEALSDSMLSVARILGHINENALAEGICDNEKATFAKICEEYAGLLSYKPDDIEYLNNYLRISSGIVFCHMAALRGESQLPLVLDIMNTYGKIMKLDPDNPDIPDSLYEMTEQFADYCMDCDCMGEAQQVYEKLQGISEDLLKSRPDDVSLLGLLANTYDLMASFYVKISDTEKAYQYYLKSLSVLENRLGREDQDIFYMLSRSRIFGKMGLLYSGSGDYDSARSYYEKALETFEDLLELPQEYEFLFDDYIELLEGIAVFFEENEPFEEAVRCYLDEVRVYNCMIKAGIDVTDNELCIAETFGQIAKLYGFEEDTEKAKEYYEKELAVYEGLLLEYPREIGYEIDIARILDSLGNLYSDSGGELAEGYYGKALDIFKRIEAEVSGKEWASLAYARTLKDLANFYSGREQYEAAISPLHQAIVILEEMVKNSPDMGVFFKELGNQYSALAVIYDLAGDAAMSSKFHSKALDTYSHALFDEPCILYTRDKLARDILLEGSLYMRDENYEVSRSYLELCRTYYENICKMDMSDLEMVECLARTLRQIGFINYSTGYPEEAISNYQSSLVLLEIAARDNADDMVLLSNTATVYAWLGAAYCAVDRSELSRPAFEKSIDTLEEIIAKYPQQRYLFLDMQIKAFSGYADVLSREGKTEEAARYDSRVKELRSEYEKFFQDDEYVDY
ncbi:tetratricopeptide repeat protein [Methanolobus psychrotolerans]|uniref:tetratricopeptide repeat protein n=1 Tax=Methanolobus psychrotolerans TaxID=1874706 RepID=UPI000B915C7C|nr:tetratricopeptide repeat protein [Methanolobus psychrotolerans]